MNVFQILVVAIVAGILIYIAMGLFQPSDAQTLEQLRKGLDFAEQSRGKLHLVEIGYRKDFSINAANFDSPSRNVRLECSSVETCSQEKISLTPRLMLVKQQALRNTYFRCKDKGINDCVLYFGEKPAQVGLRNVVFSEPKAVPGSVTFSVTNTGSLDAIDSTYAIKVYLRDEGSGRENLVLKKETKGLLKKMVPGEVQDVRHQVDALAEGKYILKVSVDGEDAGADLFEQKFVVAGKVSGKCVAEGKGRTVLDNDMCRTQYTCSGCGSGAECSARWIERGLAESEINPASQAVVYAQTPAVNGECK